MKIKGFTLIEMIIVIIIVAILLAALSRFNNHNIFLLENKTMNEKVINLFENAFLRINSSQYIQSKEYQKVQISFLENSIVLAYLEENEYADQQSIILNKEEVNGLQELTIQTIDLESNNKKIIDKEAVTINLAPFHITSNIINITNNEHYSNLYFDYKTKGGIHSCFSISEQYARIKYVNCENLNE